MTNKEKLREVFPNTIFLWEFIKKENGGLENE